jgi:pimeloyl-ACP methyl ester carboxylesterase
MTTPHLTTPEYSLVEGFRTIRNEGFDFAMNAMWEELKDVDLAKEIQSIEVPIYFFEGRYDMAIPKVVVEEFYGSLDAKEGKKLFIFEESGHMPMIEEKEKYQDVLIDVVSKESQR